MEYVPSSFTLVQGVKDVEQYGRTYADGKRFRPRGFGWGEMIVSSRLILTLSCVERVVKLNIITFFQSQWGKLSQLRQDAIVATMPETVEIAQEKGDYQIDAADLMAWLERAKAYHSSPARKAERRAARAVERKEEMRLERAMRIREEDRRRNALQLHLSFEKRRNPRHGYDQWQARYAGRFFVLDRRQSYDPSEGAVLIEVDREIGLNITLVKRI